MECAALATQAGCSAGSSAPPVLTAAELQALLQEAAKRGRLPELLQVRCHGHKP